MEKLEEFKEINVILYQANYEHDLKRVNEIWEKIKENKKLLEWAVRPKYNSYGEINSFSGLFICNCMLIDYDNVDKDIYKKLIERIYSDERIARITVDEDSFLVKSLKNNSLELSDRQKKFVEEEAMYKVGTRFYCERINDYSKEEAELKTSSTSITKNIDKKEETLHYDMLLFDLHAKQSHGTGVYDIRYYILKNPNWSIGKKEQLIYDFWLHCESYDKTLEQWELGIINKFPSTCRDTIKAEYLYNFRKKDLTDLDEETAKKIWDEIQFCSLIHQLRPPQYESEFGIPKTRQKYIVPKISD